MVDCTPKDYEWKRISPTLFFWEQTSSKTGSFIFLKSFSKGEKSVEKPWETTTTWGNSYEWILKPNEAEAEAVVTGPTFLKGTSLCHHGPASSMEPKFSSSQDLRYIPSLSWAFSTIQKPSSYNVPLNSG